MKTEFFFLRQWSAIKAELRQRGADHHDIIRRFTREWLETALAALAAGPPAPPPPPPVAAGPPAAPASDDPVALPPEAAALRLSQGALDHPGHVEDGVAEMMETLRNFTPRPPAREAGILSHADLVAETMAADASLPEDIRRQPLLHPKGLTEPLRLVTEAYA